MTKKEVAKQLRSKLSAAIRVLPDDVDYQNVSVHEDITTQMERDHEAMCGGNTPDCEGALHVVELIVEEARCENADRVRHG